jgi:hypothetical protein
MIVPYDIARERFNGGVFFNSAQRSIILNLKRITRSNIELGDLFQQHGIIFIHIPKNGGSSVVRAIYGQRLLHHSAQYHHVVHKKQFSRLPTFAIWRDPVARFYSAFYFLRDHSNRETDRNFANEVYGSFDTPADLVYAIYEDSNLRNRLIRWSHFLPQTDFVCDPHGKIMVDWIGCLDNMNAVASELSTLLGRKVDIGHVNSGKKVDYFDDEAAKIIREIYSQDDIFYQKILQCDNYILKVDY